MTDQEKIISLVKRIKRLSAIFDMSMVGAKTDYGMEDNEVAEAYEDCLDELHRMFPDVLSYNGVFHNIELDCSKDNLDPIK